jgi:predicted MPP superfamily phosphohydrolase
MVMDGSNATRKMTRRFFLRGAIAATLGAVAAAAGGTGYALALEPAWLVVEHIAVRVRDLPPPLHGLTLAHLSDLHRGPYTSSGQIRAAVQKTNTLSPDLIVLTGDYVFQSADYATSCSDELAALRAPLGVYAIPGNHDHWTNIGTVTAQLSAAGLTVLRNQSRLLDVKGAALWVAGVDDVMEGHDDLQATLAAVPPGQPVLLLVHEPDFADEAARTGHQILLQLSGHSHGGQIRLPLLGPPFLPPLGRKYPAGLQAIRGASWQVYTSRGIGVISPPFRFNCRPEVALITLLSSL